MSRHFQISLASFTERLHRMLRTWRAREVVIDLRWVSTREDFQRELSRHIPMAADHRDIWPSLHNYFAVGRGGPLRLRLLGWSRFEQKMPRYARRLRRSFAQPLRLWSITVTFE
ncbi:MAG: hypothetical protein B7Z73_07290 [Planctomycetia bacterium 21-64-5]|nr:MAG: hypothetical protein B7Z73_07290 [Planctomycetia bacterium 21-64-5]